MISLLIILASFCPAVKIFSDQPKNLTTKEGDHVTISCTRNTDTYAEWKFVLPDGTHYFYTQNKSALENMGFHFYDSNFPTDNLQHFHVTITATMELNNLTVQCAAKETEESDPVFNSFTDIIIIEKGLF